jgi:hypothetical protein
MINKLSTDSKNPGTSFSGDVIGFVGVVVVVLLKVESPIAVIVPINLVGYGVTFSGATGAGVIAF